MIHQPESSRSDKSDRQAEGEGGREKPAGGRLGRMRANLLAVLVGLFVAAMVVEIAFRAIGLGRPVVPIWQGDAKAFVADSNDELVFTFRPGFRGVIWSAPTQINRLGMRDEEIAAEKASGEFRILMLGDSVTFGVGVAPEQTFVKRLEKYLNEGDSARRFRVYNGGVPSYNTVQEYHFLARLVGPIKPDLVVLNFTLTNDWETPYRLGPNGYIAPTAVRAEDFIVRLPFERSLGRVSYFYRFVAERLRRRILAPRREALLAKVFRVYREDGEGWRKCKDYLLRMKRLLDEHGARLALFIYPEPTRRPACRREDYRFLDLHEIVERFCRENGIAYLDILDDFLAVRRKERLFITPADAHPSPFAHDLVARGLLRELRRLGLIATGDRGAKAREGGGKE